VPSTSPSPTDSDWAPRFGRIIALLSGAAARIIEISALDPPDPRGDAPIGLDLSAVSGISVPTGKRVGERCSAEDARKEQMA
jgi:hypothetical protein